MRNDELIGLAKNRFLPEEVQIAIAKNGYTRAHWYLCENQGLGPSARDYLWSDECNKGYSLKTMLLGYGHYKGDDERYRELYDRYNQYWSRSAYRFASCFFGHYWTLQHNGPQNTPSDLLNRIYDEKYAKPSLRSPYGYSSPRYELQRLAEHPNVDLELAIKLSQCGHESIQKRGFEKIVELSK